MGSTELSCLNSHFLRLKSSTRAVSFPGLRSRLDEILGVPQEDTPQCLSRCSALSGTGRVLARLGWPGEKVSLFDHPARMVACSAIPSVHQSPHMRDIFPQPASGIFVSSPSPDRLLKLRLREGLFLYDSKMRFQISAYPHR